MDYILTTHMWGGGHNIWRQGHSRAAICVLAPLAPSSVLTQPKGPSTEPISLTPAPLRRASVPHPTPTPREANVQVAQSAAQGKFLRAAPAVRQRGSLRPIQSRVERAAARARLRRREDVPRRLVQQHLELVLQRARHAPRVAGAAGRVAEDKGVHIAEEVAEHGHVRRPLVALQEADPEAVLDQEVAAEEVEQAGRPAWERQEQVQRVRRQRDLQLRGDAPPPEPRPQPVELRRGDRRVRLEARAVEVLAAARPGPGVLVGHVPPLVRPGGGPRPLREELVRGPLPLPHRLHRGEGRQEEVDPEGEDGPPPEERRGADHLLRDGPAVLLAEPARVAPLREVPREERDAPAEVPPRRLQHPRRGPAVRWRARRARVPGLHVRDPLRAGARGAQRVGQRQEVRGVRPGVPGPQPLQPRVVEPLVLNEGQALHQLLPAQPHAAGHLSEEAGRQDKESPRGLRNAGEATRRQEFPHVQRHDLALFRAPLRDVEGFGGLVQPPAAVLGRLRRLCTLGDFREKRFHTCRWHRRLLGPTTRQQLHHQHKTSHCSNLPSEKDAASSLHWGISPHTISKS